MAAENIRPKMAKKMHFLSLDEQVKRPEREKDREKEIERELELETAGSWQTDNKQQV